MTTLPADMTSAPFTPADIKAACAQLITTSEEMEYTDSGDCLDILNAAVATVPPMPEDILAACQGLLDVSADEEYLDTGLCLEVFVRITEREVM